MIKSGMEAAREKSLTPLPMWRVGMFGPSGLRACYDVVSSAAPSPPQTVCVERFQTQKTALLFSILAARPGEKHGREALLLRLWPDAEPASGRDRLSQALGWLRRNLEASVNAPPGSVVGADRNNVWLDKETVSSDAALFAACAADPARWEETIALYSGPFLPGIAEEDTELFGQQQQFALWFERALETGAEACVQTGRLAAAVTYARRLAVLRPTDEAACLRLMDVLSRTGDETANGDEAALRAFSAFSRRLKENGRTPGAALRRHAEELQARRGKVADAFTPPPNASCFPLIMTRCFGREGEIKRLLSELPHERFVTLSGPGGSGKTRLAIEVGQRFASPPTGDDAAPLVRAAFFVSLEGAATARDIIPAIFLGLQAQTEPRDDGPQLRATVARLLKKSAVQPLLILDNCEHLAQNKDVVGVLADLLLRVPTLTLLATSRIQIGLEGEHVFPVAPLPTPPAASQTGDALLLYPSVAMFADRARRVATTFELTEQNQGSVAALCRRLEGLPLAIELCAAWAGTLTPSQMLAELESRFDLLVTRRPDVPDRHRSMWAAVETSFKRLSPELRQVWTHLSVFRGGWDFDAAHAVAASSAGETATFHDTLAQLREHSLIVAENANENAPFGSFMRYRLLDVLREFAWEQLNQGEQNAASEQHAAYYLTLAETLAPLLNGPQQKKLLSQMETEHSNFRAALLHYQETANAEAGLRLCVALRPFWLFRGYLHEASRYLELFFADVERAPQPSPSDPAAWKARTELLAKVQFARGRVVIEQGDHILGRQIQENALHLWRQINDGHGVAVALLELGINLIRQGDLSAAEGFLHESLAMAKAADAELTIAQAIFNLGAIALNADRLAEAKERFKECLPLARRLENGWLISNLLNDLGEIARLESDLASATVFYEEALAVGQTIEAQASTVLPLLNLSDIARLTGDAPKAQALLFRCLRLMEHHGEGFLTAQCFWAAATVAEYLNQPTRAALALGGVQAVQAAMNAWLPVSDPDEKDRLYHSLRDRLGEMRFEIALARGAALSRDAMMAFLLSDAPDL